MDEKTVAWIEDDSEEIAAVIKPLQRAGFQFKPYFTYSEALEKIDEIRQCDLILLDLILPPGTQMSPELEARLENEEYLGLFLLEQLRSEFQISAPVIVLSVVAGLKSLEEKKNALPDVVFLAKPIRPSVLKSTVYRALGMPEI